MWHCRVEGGFFCISWLFLLSNRNFLLRQGQEPVSNCGTNYRTSLSSRRRGKTAQGLCLLCSIFLRLGGCGRDVHLLKE